MDWIFDYVHGVIVPKSMICFQGQKAAFQGSWAIMLENNLQIIRGYAKPALLKKLSTISDVGKCGRFCRTIEKSELEWNESIANIISYTITNYVPEITR